MGTGQQMPPVGSAEARRFGADAISEYRARRANRGCVMLEVLVIVGTAAVLTWAATDLSGPTVISLALIAVIAGNVMFSLPIVRVVASVLASVFWGVFAHGWLAALGNEFLGIVGGIVIGLLSLRIHLGAGE